jgi:hypothetical protein
MFKIRVSNFQAAESAELEVSGLTVLTGQNNGGKSVMVRAFHAAFTNAAVKSYVRKGEKSLSVEVEFDDGNALLWEKGGNLNRYTVNGKELSGVGSGVPEEVQAFGIVPVEAGGHTLWPQISTPMESPLFLIDKPGSAFAEAVSDTERVGLLADAVREVESDIRSDKAELKVRQKDLLSAKAGLDRYAGLDALAPVIESLKQADADAKKTAAGIEKVTAWKSSLQRWQGVVANINVDSIHVEALPPVQDLVDISRAGARYKSLSASLSRYQEVEVPEVPASNLTQIRDLRNRIVALRKIATAEVPDLPVWEKEPKAYDFMITIRRFRELSAMVLEDAKECEELDKKVRDITAQLAVLEESMGKCPTCGRPIHG